MKKIILALAIFLTPLAANAAGAKVTVNGLVCAFCATGIEKAFGEREEVSKVKVDLDAKLVTLGFKDGKNIEDAEITETLEDSGYNVVKIERE